MRPAPPRRLTGQPGFAACFAASLMILVGGVGRLATARIDFGSSDVVMRYPHLALKPSGRELGLIVGTSWFWRVVGRRRRPERTWIDRAGIAIGLYWPAVRRQPDLLQVCTAGIRSAIRMPMIAMTTSNPIRVKPRCRCLISVPLMNAWMSG